MDKTARQMTEKLAQMRRDLDASDDVADYIGASDRLFDIAEALINRDGWYRARMARVLRLLSDGQPQEAVRCLRAALEAN